jgi:hypothetical protein
VPRGHRRKPVLVFAFATTQQHRSSASVWNLSWEVIPLIHHRFIVSYFIQIQKRPTFKVTNVERFTCSQPQASVSCVFVRVRACEHPGCVAIAGDLFLSC